MTMFAPYLLLIFSKDDLFLGQNLNPRTTCFLGTEGVYMMCECGPKRLAMGLQQKQASDKRDKVSRMSPNSLDIWNSKTNKPIWQQIQDFYITRQYGKANAFNIITFKKNFPRSYRNQHKINSGKVSIEPHVVSYPRISG